MLPLFQKKSKSFRLTIPDSYAKMEGEDKANLEGGVPYAIPAKPSLWSFRLELPGLEFFGL
jgi:hypothetical protein